MSSSDGESIFLTQSKFQQVSESDANTDSVLNDILDMEGEKEIPKPNFDVQINLFSDVSDEELINSSQDVERISRFLKPLNQQDLDALIQSGLSKKTEAKCKWALNLFDMWQQDRKKKKPDADSFMYQDIMTMKDEEIDKCLSYFVAEVKNKSGEDYKPNTVYEIVCSIQHFMRKKGRFVSFLDDKKYEGLRSVLDSKMKELSSRGLGLERKKAEIISAEQENTMWCKGILGRDSPQQLLDTLLFQLGLHFALRAGQEHRNLRCGANSQIRVCSEPDGTKYLEYKEDVSKTNRGGLQHKHLQPKITRAYQNKVVPERCPVMTYEKYLSLRQVYY
jgi:hypothetical protein